MDTYSKLNLTQRNTSLENPVQFWVYRINKMQGCHDKEDDDDEKNKLSQQQNIDELRELINVNRKIFMNMEADKRIYFCQKI